MYRCYHVEL